MRTEGASIITLKRAADAGLVLPPGISNGPTEALDRRLEHVRGSALGFRNLTNYITRSLLETGASGRYHAL